MENIVLPALDCLDLPPSATAEKLTDPRMRAMAMAMIVIAGGLVF